MLAVLLGTCALAACTTLPPGDVVPDASRSQELSPGCELALPPERPEMAKDSSAEPDDLVFAMRSANGAIELDDDGLAEFTSLGYDLDGICTGPNQRGSCQQRVDTKLVVDGPGGRDHSLNELFLTIVTVAPNDTLTLLGDGPTDAPSGRATLLIRLRGYNREPDDPSVDVALYSGSLWPSPDEPVAPRWDGHDAWRPAAPWLLNDGPDGLDVERPRYRDRDAYVTDSTLVVRFDALLFGSVWTPMGVIHRGVITARLAQSEDGQWVLRDGIIAGRWKSDALFGSLARDEDNQCRTESYLERARGFMCPLLDVRALDDVEDAPCDAFSMVYSFSSEAATLGTPLSPPPSNLPVCPTVTCDGTPVSRETFD